MPNDGTGTSWDEANPGDANPIGQGAREIRDLRIGTRIRLSREHDTLGTNLAGGTHKPGSAKAYYQITAPTLRPDGTTTLNSADAGRLWFKEHGAQQLRLAYVWTGSVWFPLRAIQSEAVLQDRKSNGVHGGNFTSGAWQVRGNWAVLASGTGGGADVFANIIGGASDIIQIPAGRYRFWISAPAHRVNQHQARLVRTNSGGTFQEVLIEGTSGFSGLTGDTTLSIVQGEWEYNGSDPWFVQLQHRCNTTRASDGLGTASGWADGTAEVYAIAKITRIS